MESVAPVVATAAGWASVRLPGARAVAAAAGVAGDSSCTSMTQDARLPGSSGVRPSQVVVVETSH